MPSADQILRIYRDIAEIYHRQGDGPMRDRFLVLAMDAAITAGRPDDAERLRSHLRQHSPDHLLNPYNSFTAAMQVPEVEKYVTTLRRRYTPEAAEQLLQSLRANRSAVETKQVQTLSSTATHADVPMAAENAASAGEPQQLFRVQAKEEAPRPPAAGPAPKPKAAAAPVAKGSRNSGPPSVPDVYPLRPEPAPARAAKPRAPVAAPEPDFVGGFWIASGLYLVVLLGGLALVGYTLARPFLPPDWLP